jgi:hypothetical protein
MKLFFCLLCSVCLTACARYDLERIEHQMAVSGGESESLSTNGTSINVGRGGNWGVGTTLIFTYVKKH